MVIHERVSELEAEEHRAKFDELIGVEYKTTEEAPSEALYDDWIKIIPREQYGTVSLVSTPASFSNKFQDLLKAGENTISASPNGNSQLEAFIVEFVEENGYEEVYRAKRNPNIVKTEKDKIIATQHSDEFLRDIRDRLNEFAEKIEKTDVPEQYKDEYRRLVSNEHQYIKAAMSLCLPDFTNLQKSPESWGEYIDIDSSRESGGVVLPYEQEAKQVLVRNKHKGIEARKENMEEVLTVFDFNESEKEYLEIDSFKDAYEMDSDQIKKLIEVLINRMGISDWIVEIDNDSTVINVEQKAKKIKIPSDRILEGKNAVYVPSHEIFHAVRGENGSNQGLGILRDGVDEYLVTEEGAGAVAEMIMGEEFGHERQLKFAARYHAVAMALKARMNDDGGYEPVYSTQDIFNELTDYGLSKKDAAETVWRVVRGTSLKRKTLFVQVEKDGNTYHIPTAECYTKDTAYFEGQMQVFQWIKNHVPLKKGMREDVTINSPDFSDQFLARIGLSREEADGMKPEIREHALRYGHLVQLGRKTLIDIINVLGAGKMRLDFLEDGSNWFDLLHFGQANGMIDYSNILKSKKFKH